MQLTKGQENALKIACQRYKNHEKYTVIAGYAGTGKAQPVDTKIPTPEGIKLLGDLKVGDYVFDREGNPTKVLGTYPQGLLDCYKVTLADGRVTYCNDEHLWSYYYSCADPKYNHKLHTKTLREMIDGGITRTYTNKNGRTIHSKKYVIPVNNAVKYETKQFSIDPYVIGAFIGDGCCRDRQLGLSSKDEEIVSEVSHLLGATKYEKRKSSYTWHFFCENSNENNNKIKFSTYDILGNFESIYMKYSYEKHIPDEYKYGDINQRFSLIQGLMDTDGNISYNKKMKSYLMRFSSTSEQLIKDMQEIINSLGYLTSISVDKREQKYSIQKCYTLYINVPNADKAKFFRLKRKHDFALGANKIQQHRRYDQIGIKNIEKMPYQKEMMCIYVDNPEHLYLTNDYIVTHNTTLVQYIISSLNVDKKDVAYISYTGRASLVLRNKGCENAITAHKFLYHAKEKPDGSYEFTPKKALDENYKIVVLDEASMLPVDMWELLLTHNVYVLALGDQGQLPPIEGNSEILEHPHAVLDEIVRQALESPIIRLSMDIRNGKYLEYGGSKDCRIIPPEKVSDKLLLGADQVICGKNITRHTLNEKIRKIKWQEMYSKSPINGDKCICLKNQWDRVGTDGNPLVNGMIGTLNDIFLQDTRNFKPEMSATFTSDNGGFYSSMKMDYKIFAEKEPTINKDNWMQYPKYMRPYEFDYGYVITTHKSQGSEFDKVIVYDEWLGDKEYHKKWLYTAVTRSSRKLAVVKK